MNILIIHYVSFLDKRERVDEFGKNSDSERLEKISEAVKVLLENIGEDVSREGLLRTPERYAKALLFLTKGYTEDLEGNLMRYYLRHNYLFVY